LPIFLKAKYFPKSSILESRLGSKPSYAWQSIHNAGELVKAGMIWRIGNGAKVNIWGEKWIPLPHTYMIQSPPINFLADAKVSRLIEGETHWWDISLLNSLFSPEEVKAIISLPVALLTRRIKLSGGGLERVSLQSGVHTILLWSWKIRRKQEVLQESRGANYGGPYGS
jgi:hypothetical protein